MAYLMSVVDFEKGVGSINTDPKFLTRSGENNQIPKYPTSNMGRLRLEED